jgi:choline kinase
MNQSSNSDQRHTLLKAVILAAGASTRLRPLTSTMPKCLLKAGGKTLLEQTIENILGAGVVEIAIVIGYKGEMIRDFVKQKFPHCRVRFIINPNYAATNNAYSLLLARRFLENNKGNVNSRLLLLDSDILFSPQLLPFLLSHSCQGLPASEQESSQSSIAVRVSGEHDQEEIRVKTDGDRNIELIGKEIPLHETSGESIGIEVFSVEAAVQLFKILERRIRNGIGRTEFYEASFQEMIRHGMKIQAVDVSAFPAIEIDTVEDFQRAERLKLS